MSQKSELKEKLPQVINDPEIKSLTEFYFKDQGKEIRKISDQILNVPLQGKWKSLNLAQKDQDDFYSLAGILFLQILPEWDRKREFRGFFYDVLKKKFSSELRDRERIKRGGKVKTFSINAEIGEDGSTVEDLVASDFSVERECQNSTNDPRKMGKEIQSYWSGLSQKQKRLLMLQVDGFSASEIKEQMQLKEKEYQRLQNSLRSYEHVSKLYSYMDNSLSEKEEGMIAMKTEESKKNIPVVVKSIIRKIRTQAWRRDHPLQRPSGLWTPITMSEFISDVLHYEMMPSIFVNEEIRDEGTIYWVSEGNQRCGLLDSFAADGFKISNLIHHPILEYRSATEFTETKSGIRVPVVKTCDLRGKKFSQLPEEVKEMFYDFPYPVAMSLNCSPEDTAYDIARFNRAKPMTRAQVGWTEMNQDLAIDIENMINNVDFFRPDNDNNNFKPSDSKNGSIRRMIVETLMVMNFLDKYSNKLEKNCQLLSQYAETDMIPRFFSLIQELETVLSPELADLFTISGSTFWITLFSKFKTLQVDGEKIDSNRFADFLKEFKNSLHAKVIDGNSWDTLGTKNDRQRWGIQKKMNVLLNLMWEYFEITPPEESESGVEQEEVLHNELEVEAQESETIKGENAAEPAVEEEISQADGEEHSEVIQSLEKLPAEKIDTKKLCEEVLQKEVLDEDIDFWKLCLEDTVEKMKIGSTPHLEEENMPSLIALVAWIYDKEKDECFEEWLRDYFKQTSSYEKNQRENFLKMRIDFCFYEGFYARKEAS